MMMLYVGIYVTPLVCSTLEDFLATLGFLNSALNPILYTFLGQNFKERLRDSVRKTRINLFGRNFRANKIYNRSSCSEKKVSHRKWLTRSSDSVGLFAKTRLRFIDLLTTHCQLLLHMNSYFERSFYFALNLNTLNFALHSQHIASICK